MMPRAAVLPRPADQRDTGLEDAELRERLAYTWGRRPGFIGWLTTVDHKEIGRRYLVTAFVMLALGGLLAAIIRLQLARSTSSGPISTTRFSRRTAPT
jgi:cytochrome c oxidase subunit 1